MNAEMTPEQELESWTAQRLAYPGWLVLPGNNRQQLVRDFEWSLSRGLANGLLLGEAPDWPLEKRFDAWFELNWRLERALYPLPAPWVERMEALLAEAAPFAVLLEQDAAFFGEDARKAVAPIALRAPWIALAVAVLRHHREFRHHDAFFAWLNRLPPLAKEWDEIHHQCAWQEALWHVTFMDDAKALEIVEAWQTDRGCDPYWLARKAGLLAQLYRQDDAKLLWHECLRRLQGIATDRAPFFASSRESAVLEVLLQTRRWGEDFGENEANGIRDRIRDLTGVHGWEHRGELGALTKFDVDRREELEEMEANTNTIYAEGFAPWKPLEGVQCFRLAEELGFPPSVFHRFSSTRLSIISALTDSLADLGLANDVLAGTSLLRLRSSDIWEKRLDPAHMAAIPDSLLSDLIIACDNAWRQIESGPGSDSEMEHRLQFAGHLLRRLMVRMDGAARRDWLIRVMALSGHPAFQQHWRIPLALRDTINDLAKTIEPEHVAEVLPLTLDFPLPKKDADRDHTFPDPFARLPRPTQDISPLPESTYPGIREIIRQSSSSESALYRLIDLARRGLLPEALKPELAAAIWPQDGSLPDISHIRPASLLILPEPAPGHAKQALARFFTTTPPTNLASPDLKILPSGKHEWCRDLHYVCKPYRWKDGPFIDWSPAEADAILSLAEDWWRNEGIAIVEKWGLKPRLRNRLYHLKFALARGIAPALSPGSDAGKVRLPKLLEEIEEAGIPVLSVRPSLLRFKIGDASSVTAQLLEGLRAKDMDTVHDAAWGMVLWHEFKTAAKLAAPPHRLMEEMLIFLAARAEGESATEIVGTIEAILEHSPNDLSTRARERLDLALDALQMRTRYPEAWHQRDGQRFRHVVELRRNAVLLASAIHKAKIRESDSVRYWLDTGRTDPLSEVRRALKA